MLIIPAIDLKDGCVVRYVQGKTDKKVYSRFPVKIAKHWLRQGAKMLHIIDLDGAFSGTPKNIAVVRDIAKETCVPIQFGGGVRKMETINDLLEGGVSRVILGTRAIEDKAFLKKAFKKFGHKVIVSLDARGQSLAVRGWKSVDKKLNVISFAKMLKSMGFEQVIYTDTTKDGTLSGPNIQGIKKLIKESGLTVVASGGISSLADISKLKALQKKGVAAVIAGKALYEGKFTLTEAIKLAQK